MPKTENFVQNIPDCIAKNCIRITSFIDFFFVEIPLGNNMLMTKTILYTTPH